MRYSPTIFSALVEPLDRRRFDAIVARRDGDAYDKSFFSWNHLLALIYAQLSDLDSLRALEAGWNANSQHHYHLGCGARPPRPSPTPTSAGPSRSSSRLSNSSPACSIGNAETTAALSSA